MVSFFFSFFEAGSHYVAQAGLELVVLCLRFPSARITSVSNHAILKKLQSSNTIPNNNRRAKNNMLSLEFVSFFKTD
jgi:hypothetical protein